MTATPARYHSPDEVAEMLGLHVRTVRRHIREGRLEAVRIGNRYRIPAAQLTGPGRAADDATTTDALAADALTANALTADVSTVVDLGPISPTDADRLTTLLGAAAASRGEDRTHLRVDVIHDPGRERVKVVVIGTVAHTQAVLGLIAAFQEG